MSEKEDAARYITAFECLAGRYGNGSGVFVLGCIDKIRNTVLSQQHRAISLINALDCSGRFDQARNGSRPKIAIVGGGVAGITAAVYAVKKGVEVHLFEKNNDVLTLFQGASHRSIHPNLFNWPKDGALNSTAQIPYLSWSFATAAEVVVNLREQFNQYENRFAEILKVYRRKTRRLSTDVGSRPTLVTQGDGDPLAFDHVVVAVGFGEESKQSWHGDSYWVADNFTSARFPTRREFLVVGNGDGGLIDCLRLRLGVQGINFENQIVNFLREWNQKYPDEYEGIREAIKKIEGDIPRLHESTDLREKYSALIMPNATNLLREKDWLRNDTKVYLVGRSLDSRDGRHQTILGGWQAPINRLMISLLQRIDEHCFEYIKGDFEIAPGIVPVWTIKTNGEPYQKNWIKSLDSRCLILRTGPRFESPLKDLSTEVWQDAQRNQTAISKLDLNADYFRYPAIPLNLENSLRNEVELQELPALPDMSGIEKPSIIRRHPYLLGTPLVGRSREIENLREWLSKDSQLNRMRCICDDGGGGKTALVWAWLTDKETQTLRNSLGYREFWTSFYARDYGWRSFIRDLADAVGKKAPEDYDDEKVWRFVANDIINHLKSEKWLLVLDGIEREMEAYASEANFGADSEEQDSRKEAGLVCESEKRIRNSVLSDFLQRLFETKSKTLITTRIFPQDLDGIAEEYPLIKAPLNNDLAMELWHQQTQISGTTEFFDRFYRLVGFHPQTIAVVSSAVEAASDSIESFDNWFKNNKSDIKELCLDEYSSLTSRRHRWLELATSDLPTERLKDWILLCRVTSRSNSSNREALVQSLVRSGNPPLFENEQKMLLSIERLQKRRLLGHDRNTGDIDIHPVIRTVVYKLVAMIKAGKEDASRELWNVMRSHLNDHELRLKELTSLDRNDRAKRMDEASGLDSRIRLDLFRDFYLDLGTDPWLRGLPALLLRKDQASVDLRTALALSELGDPVSAEQVIARAKLLFELNNDDEGFRECVSVQNWIWLYGGSLFDFENRYLDMLLSGPQNSRDIYYLAISLAIRHHESAAALLERLSGSVSRWELQTVAEGFFYLENYERAEELASKAWSFKEESVGLEQVLWEWVTLGLAKLRLNDLDNSANLLRAAHNGSRSIHYKVVRLLSLAGLIDQAFGKASELRQEIDIRPRINDANRYFREYDEIDPYRRYRIPACDALLANARVQYICGKLDESESLARESLNQGNGDYLGFSYVAGVKRTKEFLEKYFPNVSTSNQQINSRQIREHEKRLKEFLNSYLRGSK